MPAVRYDITIEEGATFHLPAVAFDRTGAVRDLTGYDALMQIRATIGSVVLLEASTDNGFITITGAEGLVVVSIPPSATTGLTWKDGVYDLKVFDGTDDGIRIVSGNAYYSPQVSVEV